MILRSGLHSLMFREVDLSCLSRGGFLHDPYHLIVPFYPRDVVPWGVLPSLRSALLPCEVCCPALLFFVTLPAIICLLEEVTPRASRWSIYNHIAPWHARPTMLLLGMSISIQYPLALGIRGGFKFINLIEQDSTQRTFNTLPQTCALSRTQETFSLSLGPNPWVMGWLWNSDFVARTVDHICNSEPGLHCSSRSREFSFSSWFKRLIIFWILVSNEIVSLVSIIFETILPFTRASTYISLF